MTFDFYSYRFTFAARDSIAFPADVPGNMIRGALGSMLRKIACTPECPGHAGDDVRACGQRTSCAYARTFEPASLGTGPSGFANWPRPFVIRAAHLSSRCVPINTHFWFDMNLFDARHPIIDDFARAFAELANDGLRPARSRAELISVEQLDRHGVAAAGPPISIPLTPAPNATRRVRVIFRTPTELKHDQQPVAQPEFGVLFARARDRVSTLRTLYGAGSLDIDFRALGQRASAVRMTRCQVRYVEAERRSSRTGQTHAIGGFVGDAEYEGELTEFLPYLEAAQWTGVGRHCVWGNGELQIETIDHL